jgi:hypothetical protein
MGRPDSSPAIAGRLDSSPATAGTTASGLGQGGDNNGGGSDDDSGDGGGGGRWIRVPLLICFLKFFIFPCGRLKCLHQYEKKNQIFADILFQTGGRSARENRF